MKLLLTRPIVQRLALQFCSLFCSLLLALPAFAQEEPRTIRLSRSVALAMAIRNNVDLRVRALDSSLAETDIQASKSIYNPYLSASGTYSQTRAAGEDYGTETTSGYLAVTQTLPTGGSISASTQTGPTSAVSDPLFDYTDWSSSVGITIYQPLLKNAGRDAIELGISQDTFAYAGSLERFRDNVIQTVFSVVTEYNRLYVLRQLLESRQEAVRSAQKLLEEIKTSPNPGDNPAIEQANAEYALSQRTTDLIEAERQVSSKEATLRYLIGLDTNDHIIPVDPPSRDEPMETEVEAIALALENRPDLRDLHIQLESNQLRESVSKRNVMPDLALTASGGYRAYAQDGGFGDTIQQIGEGKGGYWSTGLLFSFPLGNDLAESTHRRDRLRSEQLKNQINAKQWKIRDEIAEDNRSLLSARMQVRATGKSKNFAEQRVAQYRKNRRLGTASVKDLLDAENDLIYARNLELNAIENFAFMVSRLWRDIGVLLERQNIHIDTSQPEQVTAGDYPLVALGVPAEPPATPSSAAPPPAKATVKPQSPATKTKPVVSAKVSAAPPAAAKSPVKPTTAPKEASGRASSGSLTLKVGEFVASELPAVKKKVEQVGLVPVVMDNGKLERKVVRLQIGSYKDLAAARHAVESFEKASAGGFVVKNETGSYEAIAGSFFTHEAAEVERKRLAPYGPALSLKEVTVVLPGYLVTAGSFSTLEAAQTQADKLAAQELSVEILANGEK